MVLPTGADEHTNGSPSQAPPAPSACFVGCSYYNAQGQLIFSQYYPANTATGVVLTAYVIDDPTVLCSKSKPLADTSPALFGQTCTWPTCSIRLLLPPVAPPTGNSTASWLNQAGTLP